MCGEGGGEVAYRRGDSFVNERERISSREKVKDIYKVYRESSQHSLKYNQNVPY